jgi:O-antigen ligase
MKDLIFSKESIFAVLLLSGTIKMVMPLMGVSSILDLTLLSAIVVTLIMISHLKTTLKSISIEKFELIVVLTLFYLFMIFSLGYTSSQSASITKTINFGTMALAFYFPLLVKDFNMKKFMLSLTPLIFICSILFLNFYITYISGDSSEVFTSMDKDEIIQMTALYLTVSWLNGILVLYYFFHEKEYPLLRWSVLIVAFIILISAGGRGPLLFTILILGVYLLYQFYQFLTIFRFNKLILPIIVVIAITGSIIFVVSNTTSTSDNPSLKLVNNTVERLMGLVTEKGGGASAHSRITNTIFSIKKINESPFWGYGIGSYGYEMTNIDHLDYPHNIFLEVWFELGYIPLLLFLFLFYQVYKQIDSQICPWCLALYFYFLLNVLKSSSLIDIRMMLGFYALFVTINYIEGVEKDRIFVNN